MGKPIDITASNTLPPLGAPWSVGYAYTYGGHKFLKETELEEGEEEERLYLGGAEFVNGQPESYYHGEGRVALTGDKPAFQYKLTDHLGNTMVLFEDKDGDKVITTESMSPDNPALVEVLQRNFYYAFGLPMQGPWNHTPADPDMPYLYNGKELEGELGLGWYAYGFRYYDASVGRFVGVDPLAGEMPDWSPFGYAYSNPISFIDFMGLAPEDDIFLRRDGTEIARIKRDGPDRYFLRHEEGDFEVYGVKHIQVLSPESLRGDVKDFERHNSWNGEILDFTGANEATLRSQLESNISNIKSGGGNIMLDIARESKEGGDLDYVNFFEDGTLYKINGIHMNSHEALNYYWGASVAALGVEPHNALRAAHAYHLYAKLTKPRYKGASLLNEANHNRAIKMGYFNFDMNVKMNSKSLFSELDYSNWSNNHFLRPIEPE